MNTRTTLGQTQPEKPTLREVVADLWSQHGWLGIAVLWVLALQLAYVGFQRHAALTGQAYSLLDLTYLTIQLISMGSGNVDPPVPWQLEVARFLLPVLAAPGLLRERWLRSSVTAGSSSWCAPHGATTW